MDKLKDTILNHSKIVLTLGITLLIAAGVAGFGILSELKNNDDGFFANDTPSKITSDKIKREFGASSSTAVVLFESKDEKLSAKSPEFKSEVDRLLRPLEGNKIISFYNTGSDKFISKDQRSTYALVSFGSDSNSKAYEKLNKAFESTESNSLKASLGGTAVGVEQTQEQAKVDLTKAELISLPILAILLFLFFRSFVGAAIPLVMSLLTIAGALAVARLLSLFVTVDTYTLNVITILSVGLSVDYSLLAVNRFREELELKKTVKQAVKTTMSTASRTIFFSGLTVIVCLLSLLFFPIDFMHSVSIGGTSSVIVAVLISTLLIPPSLMLIGHKINRKKAKSKTSKTNSWHKVVSLVTHRPILSLVFGFIFIGAFLWPISQLKTTNFGWNTLASNQSAYYVGDKIDKDFDAKGASLTALVKFNDAPSPLELCQAADRVSGVNNVESINGAYVPSEQLGCQQVGVLSRANMLPPELVEISKDFTKSTFARIDITPKTDDNSPETTKLVSDLRDMKIDGQNIEVTGIAALSSDTQKVYGENWLYVVIIIVLAMVILLGVLLSSLVIPLQAIIINSLALLISLGVIIMLFQFGWLKDLFHHVPIGGLEPSIPILISVIAFGLSMDYAVFLYSRMHEVYEETKDPEAAIFKGVVKTGPIITAAAMVLFVVVAAFATSRISIMQQIGIGLSVAVLVDAFFVRTIFVPAVMKLFGHASWYAPKWLKKISVRHD